MPITDPLHPDRLKEKQRALRGGFSLPLTLRVHRALSWLMRAHRDGDDLDTRFIHLWIGFNAAYAGDLERALEEDEGAGRRPGAPNERQRFEEFFRTLVRVDVLEKREGGGWAAAEVKSSGSVKDYYRGDLATQVWVLREAGIDLRRASIRHIDTIFVLTREGDCRGLFTDVDLPGELEATIAARPGRWPRRWSNTSPGGVTIIADNAPLERRALCDLAAASPARGARREAMVKATVDLLPVARNHWYHRDQRGSWSIKAVLPTIAAELDYGALEVKDGGDAQASRLEAADPACAPVRRKRCFQPM